ncbi:hypothetical protein GCM10009718_02580 [Isoptericola halotolerans]|uniref:Uncharacterized protein n=1 Tax=Isoptericola halotolerans TaxID=300560 RepID=A0ABX2A4H7_9MICO|nr:hypothetical protein [Isoptericola halotolerans]NOV96815.1 hypothetical protein [Isoptericola halotolerans]
MTDDLETRDVLAMIEASATGNHDILAATVATLDEAELRRTVARLCALVDLRGRVGTDQSSTAAWCHFLARMEGLVL